MNLKATAPAAALLLVVAACSPAEKEQSQAKHRVAGTTYTVRDTTVQSVLEVSGTAEPVRQATLSTKLMGTIRYVLANEGDRVVAGQTLVHIDARDVAAKQVQAGASIAEAEAVRRDAATQANRIRALYADSVATRAQLDAVETGLLRAEAGVRAARAASAELSAVSSYSSIRAPFTGIVSKRFVDPGAFAVPGSPLLSVQDGNQLRIVANATPDIASGLKRGQRIEAQVETRTVSAVVEGIVPAMSGNLYVINALVANGDGSMLPGGTATLLVPLGSRRTLVVPSKAIVREGDLTGVMLRSAEGDEIRWIRSGKARGNVVEVDAGLRAGDVVVVPVSASVTVAESN